MNIQNIQRLQLPDGRLVTIEGGDAENTAHLLATKYLGMASSGAPPPSNPVSNWQEPPLVSPSLNFDQSRVEKDCPLVSNFGQEEPLIPPQLTFPSK